MCLAGPPPGLTMQGIPWLACPYLCQSSQHLPPNLSRPITIVKFLCSFLKTVVFVDICEATHFFLFSSLPISWSTFLSVALIPYENPCIRASLSVSIYSATFSSNNSLFSSVQSLSRVLLLQPHESQHTRPPCPSPTARVYSNPCPSSQWCHPTISCYLVFIIIL